MSDINKLYVEEMFKDYADVVSPEELKVMLGIGRNKTYELLQNGEIYSKKIGNHYFVPKLCVIEYILKK